jgi:hypothetical protein
MSVRDLRWWLASIEAQRRGNVYNRRKAQAELTYKLDQRAHRVKWGGIIFGGLAGVGLILQAIVQLFG